MATHGLTEIADYVELLHDFAMTAVAGQISCPTLLVECEGDPLASGGGAGGHCGGRNQKVWAAAVDDWLDQTLARPDAGTRQPLA